jgi:CBS domain-containing protein
MTCAAAHVGYDRSPSVFVADAMRATAPSVPVDLQIRDAEALFGERDLASAWVVDEEGRLVGCLREIDFTRRGEVSPGATVRAIMSAAVCVEARCTLHEALVRMARSHVRELAIVSPEGALVGVVRDLDGLRVLGGHGSPR